MPIVCGVKFRGAGKAYYFSPGDVSDLVVGDHVVVETSRGKEMGEVTLPVQEIEESKVVGQLRPVLRRATTTDLLDAQRFRQQEADALARCREQVTKLNLPMKVTGAEYNYDGTRLTFFFTSEQRVDFRELVRELAYVFKTRIELRQIGVRDEARMVGGVGRCGRPLCCATWLSEFCPVSIRMAKQQDLPLTPMEISGVCGRLLCCLEFENSYYQEIKGKFPKAGKTITTPFGTAKVIRVSVLRETVNLLMEDGTTLEVTADQLEGRAPVELKAAPRGSLNGAQRQALATTLQGSASGPSAAVSPREEDGDEGEGAEESRHEGSRQADAARPRRPQRPRGAPEQKGPPTQAPAPSSARPAEGGKAAAEAPARSADQPARHRPRRSRGPRPSPDREPGRGEDEATKQSAAGEDAMNKPSDKRRRRPRRRHGPAREGPAQGTGQKPPAE